MKPALKPFLSLAAGGMALSLVSLAIWIYVNRDIDGLAFGRVTRVTPATLEIADRHDGITIVRVDWETKIVNNRVGVLLKNVPIGQFVQVSGERIDRQTILAKTIRFMRSPGRNAPPEAAR